MRDFNIRKEADRAFSAKYALILKEMKASGSAKGLTSRRSKDQLEAIEDDALALSATRILEMGGFKIPASRITAFVNGKAEPSNERETCAYDYLCELATVRAQYRSTHISPGVILLLHRAGYKTLAAQSAGRWRETGAFADDIPEIMRSICDDYRASTRPGECDPVVASIIFFCDFCALSPLDIGSLEMAWLIFELMMLKHGYEFVRYSSVENAVANDKAEFERTLNEAIDGWSEGKNDYRVFIEYMLDTLARCIEESGETATIEQPEDNSDDLSDEDVIREYFANLSEGVSKSKIIEAHENIAKRDIEKIIAKLRREGVIEMVGAGRKTRYRKTLQLNTRR